MVGLEHVVAFSWMRVQGVMGFLDSSAGKESAGSVGDLGSIPGSGRSSGKVNGYHSSILAWRIPWTEELGELQDTGVGCHALLQGIFLTHSLLRVLHWQADSLPLHHLGSSKVSFFQIHLRWVQLKHQYLLCKAICIYKYIYIAY